MPATGLAVLWQAWGACRAFRRHRAGGRLVHGHYRWKTGRAVVSPARDRLFIDRGKLWCHEAVETQKGCYARNG